ncbi:HNH endonuclease signature motif containing protein [Streptomyces sp. NPDC051917]|uniref:HNH endonuclease n=1 Tax=Streptomyces sp. NPDC051917 TaxID=3154754 RepID=UPI003456E11E
MDTHILGSWLQIAQPVIGSPWGQVDLRELASKETPASVLGPVGWLLKADANTTWANWYVDGLVDRAAYIYDEKRKFAQLYKTVKGALAAEHGSTPKDELTKLATAISVIAWEEIRLRREIYRGRISLRQKKELWYGSGAYPRCYLCGYRFSSIAKNKFLQLSGGSVTHSPGINLVDFVRPRGKHATDLFPQVDHVRPVANGGATSVENLRLACGWCNRHKSSHTQIYDAPSAYTGLYRHGVLGVINIPRPLWIIRIVKMRGRCEHRSGCTATLDNSELFVAPRRVTGSINPTNCAIYCNEHDPWREQRFVGLALYKRSFAKYPIPRTFSLASSL